MATIIEQVATDAFVPALLLAFMTGALLSCLVTLWFTASVEEQAIEQMRRLRKAINSRKAA